MSTAAKPLVIVGASYAGLQIAASAREYGFEEPILLIGEEPHAPYQRPPLSKGLLTGKTTRDQLPLRSGEFFTENRIELITGKRATSLDAGGRRVTLSDRRQLEYGWLALTTGARCRPLLVPGANLEGVFNLRTLDDALGVAAAADSSAKICVIGGGYIGLEVAAALQSRGKAMTLVQGSGRVLTRSMPPLMSTYVEQAHRQRGVELRIGVGVKALLGRNGRVIAVELMDGECIDCDMVVLGIGVVPNVELAVSASLAITGGIETDMSGRTSAPNVLSAGDVASMELPPWPGAPARMRLESIQAANDGAKSAAATIVGRTQPCTAIPWFWSDQFELKFQMAGLAMPGDQAIVRGDMSTDRFSVYYLRGGVLAAVHSVNKPADHMLARKLIAAHARFGVHEIADTSFELKRALEPDRVVALA